MSEWKFPGPSPWRTVEAEGDRFHVRNQGGATWIQRLSNGEIYLFDVDRQHLVPEWARPTKQQRLL